MIGLAITLWQALVGGTIGAAVGSDTGGAASTAGTPIGLLLTLTKAS